MRAAALEVTTGNLALVRQAAARAAAEHAEAGAQEEARDGAAAVGAVPELADASTQQEVKEAEERERQDGFLTFSWQANPEDEK